MISIPRSKISFRGGYSELKTGACFITNQFCYIPLIFGFPSRNAPGGGLTSFKQDEKPSGGITISKYSTPVHFVRKLIDDRTMHAADIINNLYPAASFLTFRILKKSPNQPILTPSYQNINYKHLHNAEHITYVLNSQYESLVTHSIAMEAQNLISQECKFQHHQVYIFIYFCVILSIYDNAKDLIAKIEPHPHLKEEFEIIFGFPIEELV